MALKWPFARFQVSTIAPVVQGRGLLVLGTLLPTLGVAQVVLRAVIPFLPRKGEITAVAGSSRDPTSSRSSRGGASASDGGNGRSGGVPIVPRSAPRPTLQ